MVMSVSKTPMLCFSPITELEPLSAHHLSGNEIAQLQSFLAVYQSVDLSARIIDQTISIRRTYALKPPAAIVAASAMATGMPLVSADRSFQTVVRLILLSDLV